MHTPKGIRSGKQKQRYSPNAAHVMAPARCSVSDMRCIVMGLARANPAL